MTIGPHLIDHDDAIALTATGDARNAVRLAFPYADDALADQVLHGHTTYPITLTVHDLIDEIAAAVPHFTEHLVAVECDGLVASWHPDTGFTGDETLVAAAREAVAGRYGVTWGRLPEEQAATDSDPRGALAALMDHKPGRTRIVEWPDAVRIWWEQSHDDCGSEHG